MSYAEVAVNSPLAGHRCYTYSLPAGLSITAGQVVLAPFGARVLQGVVIELCDQSPVESTRDIIGPIADVPVVSAASLRLAYQIADYYFSPLFDAVALFLPPGFKRRTLTFLTATGSDSDALLDEASAQLLADIRATPRLDLRQVVRKLGTKRARDSVARLVELGLIERSYELQPVRVKPKIESFVSLAITSDHLAHVIDQIRKRAPKQASLLDYFNRYSTPVSLAQLRQATGGTLAQVRALAARGFLNIGQAEVKRQPLAPGCSTPKPSLELTPAQAAALLAITRRLQSGNPDEPNVFLLHGVTGSGKTEIYLQALAAAVALGKKGIVLVPEIALTPQTIARFSARFPNRVAVLHSQLSLGEAFDEWRRIRDGEADVVIGPRSALFAPQPDLGLIVMDEEHETSYAQEDTSPRYHAREVATWLAKASGAVLILGSATPDVESYYRAEHGDFQLLQLPERLTPHPGAAMPQVELVDMRQELKAGNRSIFSRSLTRALEEVVARHQQAILFLNRRGGATFVQCRDCGFVLACRQCQCPLSYHPAEAVLVCHRCNRRSPAVTTCPQCRSRRIKHLGLGTQQLEAEVRSAFPAAHLTRWDSDTAHNRGAHQHIMESLAGDEVEIIIGTQMVAKGHDLPRVTLVGVVNADISLNLPNFRAGERTFDLLAQVAGRAGRGAVPGRAIVQSYTPENYAIQAAIRHDYAGFYRQEIELRRQLRYPPFSRLVRLTLSGGSDTGIQQAAERLRDCLAEAADQGTEKADFIGPAPAFVHRQRGRYRWQLTIRGRHPVALLRKVTLPRNTTVEVDPTGP